MRNANALRLGRATLAGTVNLSRAITTIQTPLLKSHLSPARNTVFLQARFATVGTRPGILGSFCTIRTSRHVRLFSDRNDSTSGHAKSTPADGVPLPNKPSAFSEQHAESGKSEPHHSHSPAETAKPLPSQHILHRSTLASRFNTSMDRLLNALAQLSQRVNMYTGTDYSGITSLRSSISAQEQTVSSLHAAVATAKEAHGAAMTAQSASNKEVVRLLERKNSWSDTDLERYMSLIRSEHENDQAVQVASEAIVRAERDLEEARAELERTERTQYHEEQIWSDTIRRNSTWVTFGLMGFNIILLLASLVVIEPWRRRRLVREIRSTLADNASTNNALVSASGASSIATVPGDVSVAETARTSAQNLENNQPSAELPITPASSQVITHTAELTPSKDNGSRSTMPVDSWTSKWTFWKAYWAYLFSDQMVSVRRIDLTTAVLEGATAGAVFMGLVFVFLRPR